jgi:hypothetical protein
MNQDKSRHESVYNRTGRALVGLFVLWIAAMLLAAIVPVRLRNSDAAFLIFATFTGTIFIASIAMGVARIVSYFRWTGRYPYSFLFHRVQPPGKQDEKGDK